MKASFMLKTKKEYATVLALDVNVTDRVNKFADENRVKIFSSNIICDLCNMFTVYIDNINEERKKDAAERAVFPCVLGIIPDCIFNKKDPILLGVDVLEGIAKVGTPICVPSRKFIDIGKITSIKVDDELVGVARKGPKAAIKITSSNSKDQQKVFGRHFDPDDELVGHITRSSVDVLNEYYLDDLSKEERRLVRKLNVIFRI